MYVIYMYIYIYIERERYLVPGMCWLCCVCLLGDASNRGMSRQYPLPAMRSDEAKSTQPKTIRPVHLLRVPLLRVLESNFPGDSLSNSMDMRIPTP